MYLLRLDGLDIVGSSPEALVTVTDRHVLTQYLGMLGARQRLMPYFAAGVPLAVPVSEEDGRVRAGRGRYDRILVDAPCTGLGALRRRPEARWRKQPADVPALATLQGELLDAALAVLAPGGIVAYVTCSPHLAETAAVVSDETVEPMNVPCSQSRACVTRGIVVLRRPPKRIASSGTPPFMLRNWRT